MSTYFLTTAIDYANGEPHVGHAYEKIGADAIARYRRLRGDDVHLLIGMDEHGQKVEQTASQQGVSPQALVDTLAETFCAMWSRLGISYDQFIRTTDQMHRDGVKALIERIFEHNPDDFYEKAYEGLYCVGCESFKQDAEIVDGKCVLHPTRTLERVQERNWFFRLSRYEDYLRRLLTDAGNELRHQIGRDGFRGTDGHPPRYLLRRACRNQGHGLGRHCHGSRVFNEVETGVRQDKPFADPFEQRDAECGLQRHDLTRQRRLGQAELARGGGERA